MPALNRRKQSRESARLRFVLPVSGSYLLFVLGLWRCTGRGDVATMRRCQALSEFKKVKETRNNWASAINGWQCCLKRWNKMLGGSWRTGIIAMSVSIRHRQTATVLFFSVWYQRPEGSQCVAEETETHAEALSPPFFILSVDVTAAWHCDI